MLKIQIERKAYDRIMHWIDKTTNEVGGLGMVEFLPGRVAKITEVFLLPQKVGGAHTDIEPEDVMKADFKMKDKPGLMCFWWHSHANMSAFWSKQDEDTIKLMGSGGVCLAAVFNKKREFKSACYVNNPVGFFNDHYGGLTDQQSVRFTWHAAEKEWRASPVYYADLGLEILAPPISDEIKLWDAEFDENVKTTPVVTHYPQHKGGWNYKYQKFNDDLTPEEKAQMNLKLTDPEFQRKLSRLKELREMPYVKRTDKEQEEYYDLLDDFDNYLMEQQDDIDDLQGYQRIWNYD